MAQPRIISIRLSEQTGGTGIEIELGTKTIEKQISTGLGLTRLSLILDEKNELQDAEIVTEKIWYGKKISGQAYDSTNFPRKISGIDSQRITQENPVPLAHMIFELETARAKCCNIFLAIEAQKEQLELANRIIPATNGVIPVKN